MIKKVEIFEPTGHPLSMKDLTRAVNELIDFANSQSFNEELPPSEAQAAIKGGLKDYNTHEPMQGNER